jgi:hypothetical protein
MLKYFLLIFIGAITLIVFIELYDITNSWKLSLSIVGIALTYLIWLIGFELGLSNSKSIKEKAEEMFESQKKEHTKATKDNPTLR